MDETSRYFFEGAALGQTKMLTKMLATYKTFAKWNFPLPPREYLVTEEVFSDFIKYQLYQRHLPLHLLYTAIYYTPKPAAKAKLQSPPPPPIQSQFTALSTYVDKLYVRSTEAPDPRYVRTLDTLHRAVILYHGYFKQVKKTLKPENEFPSDYIQFRSRMRAVRYDYQVQGAADLYLEKANHDALRAACLTHDIKEILVLSDYITTGKVLDLIAIANYITNRSRQDNPIVRKAILCWQQNLEFKEAGDRYAQSLCNFVNYRIRRGLSNM